MPYTLTGDGTVAGKKGAVKQYEEAANQQAARRPRRAIQPRNLGLRPPQPGVVPGVYKLAAEVRDAGITAIDAPQVRERGPAAVGQEAIAVFAQRGLAGFWIHLDADVLDAALMPAVDTPEPGGLTFEELTELLPALLRSGRAAGLEITIFDPDLDPDGHLAEQLADAVIAAFTMASTAS